MIMLNTEINGKLLILQNKYGNKQLFDTYEKTLDLVGKYPIVYSVIPNEFKDKNMTLAFIKANNQFKARYQEIVWEIVRKDDEMREAGAITSKRGLHIDTFEEEAKLRSNAIIDEDYNLGEFTKDMDAIDATMEIADIGFNFIDSYGGFLLTPETYDDNTMETALNKYPKLIFKVFNYWIDNIDKFPKVREHIKVAYQLHNEPSNNELAFFKCLSMIKKNNNEAIENLLYDYSMDFEANINPDHIYIMKDLFKKTSIEIQNELVGSCHWFAKYLKVGILDKTLEKIIAEKCIIAGDILTDESVIRYNLSQSLSDDESIKKCLSCNKCVWSRMTCI